MGQRWLYGPYGPLHVMATLHSASQLTDILNIFNHWTIFFLLNWSCPISTSTSTGDFLRPGHAIAEVQIRSSLSSPSSAAGGARMWTACQAADERIVWLNLFICVNIKYMWIPMYACRYDVLIYPVYMIISNYYYYYWTNSGYTTHQDTQHAKQTLIIPNNHK